jgi:dienelactone hydrolase
MGLLCASSVNLRASGSGVCAADTALQSAIFRPSVCVHLHYMRAFVSVFVFVLSLLQVGCMTAPTAPSATLLKDYADGGYSPSEHFATTTLEASWTVPASGRRISLRLTVPDKQGPARYPLVLYFPGLGETIDDGAVWWSAWAQAGYVVIAVQAEDDDARVWQSAAARNSDFDGLVRSHFSAASLQQRLLDATYVLTSARSRAVSGDALLRHADFDRIALAGFDLGSQTVLAMAARASAPSGAVESSVRAAIALSPYVLSQSTAEWSEIRVPVLSITGTIDTDPYGRLASPAQRRSPFRAMPPGDKYLLLLTEGTHDTLSGTMPAPAGAESTSPSRRRAASASMGGGDAARSRASAADTSGRDKGPPAETSENRALAVASVSRSTLQTQMHHMALVRATTLAFLDMTLKGESAARTWLAHDAARYYQAFAELQAN